MAEVSKDLIEKDFLPALHENRPMPATIWEQTQLCNAWLQFRELKSVFLALTKNINMDELADYDDELASDVRDWRRKLSPIPINPAAAWPFPDVGEATSAAAPAAR